MELPSYFKDFLSNIRLTEAQTNDAIRGHRTLRDRLEKDEKLGPLIVSTVLQGSYRRSTALRPHNGKLADVDVIVVTKLHEKDYTPDKVFALFKPFLDKWYAGKWKLQGRSIGIELSDVKLDLVPTSAPSEAERRALTTAGSVDESVEDMDDRGFDRFILLEARAEAQWKREPLRIPDREAKKWEDTHPLEQIRWTWNKNKKCNSHYVNDVKAIKWWRSVQVLTPERPKGYPIEHLISLSCPDGVGSVAKAVTLTLEDIATKYAFDAALKRTPVLYDHGVPASDVMKRVSGDDFAALHAEICKAAKLARRALDSNDEEESANLWRELFGDRFPAPAPKKKSGFSPREQPTVVGGGRFA
ncbi:MAG: nucleotidyltransferase [Planctomycetota bacterium]|nr:nucleotidyltransferase [Planctomycetota bacterium]